MPVSVSIYNHTSKLFSDGTIEKTDTFKLLLATSATFNAANTTLSGVTYTETLVQGGYTTGGKTLSGVSVDTSSTNGSKFTALDVSWAASGASITASYGILYDSTQTGSPPLLFIDFGGSKVAESGTDFLVVWDPNGIFKWSVA